MLMDQTGAEIAVFVIWTKTIARWSYASSLRNSSSSFFFIIILG